MMPTRMTTREPPAQVPATGARPARKALAGTAMPNHPLDGRYDKAARTLSLLANGTRLEILCMLNVHDRSVGELVTESGGSFPAISQQLKLLTLGGMLDRRRDGRNIVYRLKDPIACEILKLVGGLIDH